MESFRTRLASVRKVLVYGSLAYDRVMFYPGRFRDALLPDKLHLINVSFAVPSLTENFGGTAGNIAYNLALLGVDAEVVSAVGHDFSSYRTWFSKHSISLRYVVRRKELPTACAYIMTDRDDNQITAFSAGALGQPLPKLPTAAMQKSLVLISPGNRNDMVRLATLCARRNVPYVYDPGQQVTALNSRELLAGIRHALAFIGNDYEVSLVARRLRVSEAQLRRLVPLLVRTMGSRGSELWHGGTRVVAPAAKPTTVADPTGAGDAYRAGLVVGLLRGWPLEKVGRLAALVAVYTVEQYGTQTHSFSRASLRARYHREFHTAL